MRLPEFDRRTLLGIAITALIPSFALVHTVVSRYRDSRHRLAVEWSARGEQEFATEPRAAVAAFETALAYGPERTGDRLRLGEALIQAHRPVEAERVIAKLAKDLADAKKLSPAHVSTYKNWAMLARSQPYKNGKSMVFRNTGNLMYW